MCLSALLFVISMVKWRLDRPAINLPQELRVFGLFQALAACTPIFFLVVFLISPRTFFLWAEEDGIVESTSAVLLFLTSAIFLFVFNRFRTSRVDHRRFYRTVSMLLALVFFFMAMEEVSWFQRQFLIKTPSLFEGNLQNEVNLHNFYSKEVENIYYFFSFLFLIAFPFIHEKTSLFARIKPLPFFVPGISVVLISAIFPAYNYNMWNVLFIQIAFFTTLFILLHYLLGPYWPLSPVVGVPYEGQEKVGIPNRHWYFVAVLVISLLGTQAAFLAWGDSQTTWWYVYEYKELFIPVSFLFYALEIVRRTSTILQMKQWEQKTVF